MSKKIRSVVDFLCDLEEEDLYQGTIVLVRHGRTAFNAERRFLGRTDLGLDDVGLEQAAKLTALQGHFEAVFSSPLRRATQTASFLSEEVRLLKGIEELDQADLEGLHPEQAIQRFPEYFSQWQTDPSTICAPGGGESLQILQSRAVEALSRVISCAKDGPIAIVTHQLVIAVLCLYARGEPLTNWKSYTVGNIGMAALGVLPGGDRITFIANDLGV